MVSEGILDTGTYSMLLSPHLSVKFYKSHEQLKEGQCGWSIVTKGKIGMTRSRLEVNSFDNVGLNQKGHKKVNFHNVSLAYTFYC